jgi:hypothetical protein
MAWGTWTLETESSVRLGIVDVSDFRGLRIESTATPGLREFLYSPFTEGLLEINADNRIAAVGTSPDFSMLPKWRKVVRTIG